MRVPYRHVSPRRSGSGHGSFFLLGLLIGGLVTFLGYRLYALRYERDIEFLRQVRNLAADTYVEELDERELVNNALRGMVEGLDRYSRYYGPEEIAGLDRETTGEFRGIGVVFRAPTSEGQVLFPFPGSPASRAGIRVGDTLIEIDGKIVAELEPGELQQTIQTSGGRQLDVLVVGLDGEERKLTLHPKQVVDPTVRHARMLDAERGIAYLAILSFTHRTPDEFDQAVQELLQEGARALVIDVRSNPGGILDAAVRIANRFIPEGTLVATRTRDDTQVMAAVGEHALFRDLPVVVLTDEGSASASEVLAGALQDHQIGPLVGEATYGKGTVQTLTRFGDDRAIIKLTTAHYFTPSWRRIERHTGGEGKHGIEPDVYVTPRDGEREPILRHLFSYSPPPSAVEALEAWQANEEETLIPEHPADRQLETAVALLSGVPAQQYVSAGK